MLAKANRWVCCAVALAVLSAGAQPLTRSRKIVIIRYAEKPEAGDNLSCEGENRALALPAVLKQKFGRPAYAYVPAVKSGSSTKHARMFQTVTPFAVKENFSVDSKFSEDDVTAVAKDVLAKQGLVLMVWEHTQIPPLARTPSILSSPSQHKNDFDSIWIIDIAAGVVRMSTDAEGINPSPTCRF